MCECVQLTPSLPKTRSGKIMRRILRTIARGAGRDAKQLGDVSTLADSSVVDSIVRAHDVEWTAFEKKLTHRGETYRVKHSKYSP